MVVINTREAESVWNALRFATATLVRGHKVSVFLMGPAVGIDDIGDSKFDVKGSLIRFQERGGEVFSCGTCLRLRKMEASKACSTSSMDSLVSLTEEADRTLVFG